MLNKIEKNNIKFAKLLKSLNISKLNLVCCGNSISSGYSMSSFTKPLLLRNESIKRIINNESIDINMYHFSRAEDNNDEHIYDWLVDNTKLSDINRLNRFDIKNMKSNGIDDTNIDEYYSLTQNITMKDILSDNDNTVSNIIIYNGCTGSLLDNLSRKGNHKSTYGIKRDCISIESFLKYIHAQNRNNRSQTQVYLCGVPNISILADIFINSKLKSISNKYSNVTYVSNIKKQKIYKDWNNKLTFDLHYNESEYLEFNNKIIESININYLVNLAMIDIDRKLYLINKNYQLGFMNDISKSEIIDRTILQLVEKYRPILMQEEIDLKKFLGSLKEYINDRIQYDFYYIGKENINNKIKKLNNDLAIKLKR